MKKLMIALCLASFSFAALAQAVFVRNYGRNFSVEVWNHGPRPLNCSGPIWLRYEDGSTDSTHVFFGVRPRGTFMRTYFPPMNNEIRSISHSVWCR